MQALVESSHETPFKQEHANYVQKNCTAKRGSNQGQLKELVRGSTEETCSELLEQETEKLTRAARYERNEARRG